jgi:hypothetical protein
MWRETGECTSQQSVTGNELRTFPLRSHKLRLHRRLNFYLLKIKTQKLTGQLASLRALVATQTKPEMMSSN